MCFTIEQFCCCCSLRTGMLYVCTVYVLYFGICTTIQPEQKKMIPDNSFELYSSKLYWYGGWSVSVLALLGVLWRKLLCLLPLMIYEVCLFTFRIETVGSMLLIHSSVDERRLNREIVLLVIGLYVITLEYSYYRESLNENNNIFVQTSVSGHLPVPRGPPTAPCVVDVPTCNQFSDTPYPVEYGVQPPFVKPVWDGRVYGGPTPQVYPPYPPAYPPNAAVSTGQATVQPFPHGAPPPYTENPPPYTSSS